MRKFVLALLVSCGGHSGHPAPVNVVACTKACPTGKMPDYFPPFPYSVCMCQKSMLVISGQEVYGIQDCEADCADKEA